MIRIVEKIKTAVRNRTTYRAGLLQAKAYRILKGHTGERLESHGISTVEWALLGLLYDNAKGMRSSILANELGVEAPFVTVLFARLKRMGLVESHADAADSRVKIIGLSARGRQFVPRVEKKLLAEMRPLLHGLDTKDVIAYLTVLEGIIENGRTTLLTTSRQSRG